MDETLLLHAMQLDDAYHVERVLAQGPAGRTELVTLNGTGPFVRKYLDATLTSPQVWGLAMGINDPHVMRVLQLYSLPGRLVTVSEYVAGPTLGEKVDEAGALPVDQALGIMHDLCHAVALLNGKGIIHRDITPANVICAERSACLIDLGIAREHTETSRHDTTTLGTWGFAAPEQFGFAQTDARSDVYALGRLLGYLLTGLRPDDQRYEHALTDSACVPVALAVVIDRACAFEPSERFADADALWEALERASAGEGPCVDEAVAGGSFFSSGGAGDSEGLWERPPRRWHAVTIWKDLAASVRAWPKMPSSARKWGTFAAAIVVVFTAALFFVAWASPVGGTPYSPFNLPMGAVFALWGIVLPGYELTLAVLGAGEYGALRGLRRLLRAVLRILESVAIGFFFLVAVAIVESLVAALVTKG